MSDTEPEDKHPQYGSIEHLKELTEKIYGKATTTRTGIIADEDGAVPPGTPDDKGLERTPPDGRPH